MSRQVSLTPEQAARLLRRPQEAPQRPRAVLQAPEAAVSPPTPPGLRSGVLEVWVPIRPENPLRGGHFHWSKRHRWVQLRREATALYVWQALGGQRLPWLAGEPKLVTFTIYCAGFDDDNLRQVCKAFRDGLQDAGVIHHDGRSSGHVFRYHQVVARGPGARRGFLITVQATEGLSL